MVQLVNSHCRKQEIIKKYFSDSDNTDGLFVVILKEGKFMDDKNTKKITRYTNAKVYYNKLYMRIPEPEYTMITEYCKKNNISKSCFMAAAAMYYIDHKK